MKEDNSAPSFIVSRSEYGLPKLTVLDKKRFLKEMKKEIKFKEHVAGRGGWSEWVYPKKSYLFKCCDCGLVHEIQFDVFLEKNRKGKDFEIHTVTNKKIRPTFRVRRIEEKDHQ